jgi:hypothetical protein
MTKKYVLQPGKNVKTLRCCSLPIPLMTSQILPDYFDEGKDIKMHHFGGRTMNAS